MLLFVLLIWFLIYKLRYKNLGNLEGVMTIYYDFAGAVDRVKERLAEGQTPRRAVADRRRQVLMNRESRKTDTPKEFPVNRIYSNLIECRI